MFGAVPIGLIHDIAVSQGVYYQLELDLDCPPYYFINPEYLCSVFSGLKYYNSKQESFGSVSHDYHPAFQKLRGHLERNGYIETQPWHNGDRVLKPFFLNNYLLCPGDKFYCASAMGYKKEITENYNDGKILPDLKNYREDDESFYF